MWVNNVIQARWIADGDRNTSLFYKQFKGLATAKEIPELVDTQGISEKMWDGMARIVT